MGDMFYADWVEGNLQDVATWHNNEEKGDVVEALLGLSWLQTNAQGPMAWAGDLVAMHVQLETSLLQWELE